MTSASPLTEVSLSAADLGDLPPALRHLLESELAAGNRVVEIGHSFPAPPVGAYFKLSRRLCTPAAERGEGVTYYDRDGSNYSGEITDGKRHYFLLEPPRDEAARSRVTSSARVVSTNAGGRTATVAKVPETSATRTSAALARFEASRVMDFDKWHDGVGYDLAALRELSASEQSAVEAQLIRRGLRDWRDVEALACFETPTAENALRAALNNPNAEVRNAVTRCAPHLVSESDRTASLLRGLETANFFGGLAQTLDQVAEFHPPVVIEALWRGVLARSGDIAVHFAAMLCYLHGQAPEPFDFAQRPFFLRFNTERRGEREAVFRELCCKVDVDAALYLPASPAAGPAAGAGLSPDFTVEVDVRGELITYCEPHRSVHVACAFGARPRVQTGTLSAWFYPLGRRTEAVSAPERTEIFQRIVDSCRRQHRLPPLELAEE